MRSIGRLFGSSLLALLLVGAPRAVQGQAASRATDEGAPADYEHLVQRGVQEMALNNYPEARSLFLQANQRFPNARTLRALGMVEYELRNYVAALQYLDRALRSEVRPLDREKRAQVEQLRNQANGYVGRYRLRVRPVQATFTVDDTPIAQRDGEVVLMQVGEHSLEASAPGYLRVRRALNVSGGEVEELTIRLVPEAKEVAVREATAPAQPTGDPRRSDTEVTPLRKKWWLWTTIGVVLAGAAAGTAIVLMGQREGPRKYGGSAMSTLKGPLE